MTHDMMRLFVALALPAALMACVGATSSRPQTKTPRSTQAPEGSADAAAPETLAAAPDSPEPVESAPSSGDNHIPPPPAPDETPILVGGQPTGYYSLKNAGVTMRREVVECPSLLPRDGVVCPAHRLRKAQCQADSECTEEPNGFCYHQGLAPGCACEYGCKTDSDCSENQICRCGEPVGRCVDAACGPTGTCGANGCVSRYGIPDSPAGGPFDCAKEGEFDVKEAPFITGEHE